MATIHEKISSFGKRIISAFIRNKRDKMFMVLAQQIVSEEALYKSRSTVDNYHTALRSFSCFTGTDILLKDITPQLMEHYQQHLKLNGICLNTISCYMRSLRTLYNKIITKKKFKPAKHPFCNVYRGKTKTQKRSITDAEILQIKELKLPQHSYIKLCQDTFLFSFYALGMPFVDIVYLKHSQIKNGEISYYRHKNKQPVHVLIEPCIQEIIDRYYNSQRKYIFPFITSDDKQIAEMQYLKHLGRYNRNLKRIAAMAGVTANITSYTMRHTWASLAFRNNIDLPIISKALGHTNTNTTITYIREIDDTPIAEANRKLIEGLHFLMTSRDNSVNDKE